MRRGNVELFGWKRRALAKKRFTRVESRRRPLDTLLCMTQRVGGTSFCSQQQDSGFRLVFYGSPRSWINKTHSFRLKKPRQNSQKFQKVLESFCMLRSGTKPYKTQSQHIFVRSDPLAILVFQNNCSTRDGEQIAVEDTIRRQRRKELWVEKGSHWKKRVIITWTPKVTWKTFFPLKFCSFVTRAGEKQKKKLRAAKSRSKSWKFVAIIVDICYNFILISQQKKWQKNDWMRT